MNHLITIKKTSLMTSSLSTAALALLMGLTGCTKDSSSASQSLAVSSDSTAAIRNGSVADDSSLETSSIVYLSMANEQLQPVGSCSGTLIAQNVVLTAAHCVVDMETSVVSNPNQVAVIDGRNNQVAIYLAKKISVHPFYLSREGYDVALVQLSQDLPATFKPAKLATSWIEILSNPSFVAGYGATSSQPNNRNEKLNMAPISIDWPKFKNFEGVFPVVDINVKATEASVCHGDSGGPLYYVKDQTVYVYAVHHAITGQKLCSEDGDTEFSTFLNSEILRFVFASYFEMTNTFLPEFNTALTSRTIDEQLKKIIADPKLTTDKNESYDLTGMKYYFFRNAGMILFVPAEKEEELCKDLAAKAAAAAATPASTSTTEETPAEKDPKAEELPEAWEIDFAGTILMASHSIIPHREFYFSTVANMSIMVDKNHPDKEAKTTLEDTASTYYRWITPKLLQVVISTEQGILNNTIPQVSCVK